MQLIGLTGGIASGKSTCARMLGQQGIPVVDADEISRNILSPGTKAYRKTCRLFPAAVDKQTGLLNRILLGDIVFTDEQARRRLEAIIHPLVRLEIVKKAALLWCLGADRVVLDIPLLFETGLHKIMSYTICVHASEQHQRERLMARLGLTEAQAISRIAAQMSSEQKCRLADVVIYNDGSLEETKAQLMREAVLKRRPSWLLHRGLLHALPMAALFGCLVYMVTSLAV